MISHYRGRSIAGIIIGVVLSGIGGGLAAAAGQEDSDGQSLAIIALLLLSIGAIVFLWGCVMYAKGKGYSDGWAFFPIGITRIDYSGIDPR